MKIDTERLGRFFTPLVLPLTVAALIRLLFVYHGNMDERLRFLADPAIPLALADRHSLLYAAVKKAVLFIGLDPFMGLIGLNTAVSILAIVPFYIFMRARSGRVSAAYFASLGLAVHPVISRVSCSGGQYALLLLFWCFSLALLCDENPGPLRVFAGMALLTFAAMMRTTGVLYVAVTPLLLGLPACRAVFRRRPAFLAGLLLMSGLLAVNYWLVGRRLSFEDLEIGHLFPSNLDELASLPVNLLEFLLLSMRTINLLWPLYLAFTFLPLMAAILDRRWRWSIGVFIAFILIALVRTPDIGAIEPGEMYLRVTKAMVRIMLFGAGAAVVLDFFSHSWLRRLCWDIMLVFVLATPLANLDFMRERYAFNAGFELLQEIRRDAAGTGSKCALLVDVPDIELGVVNPGASVPGMRIVDCDNPAVCLKEAEAGGCLYYFRNSWCYYGATCVEADSAKDRPALKSACSELESSLKLEKIREMEVDFKKSYPGLACDSMPRAGVLGAYRVVSVRR